MCRFWSCQRCFHEFLLLYLKESWKTFQAATWTAGWLRLSKGLSEGGEIIRGFFFCTYIIYVSFLTCFANLGRVCLPSVCSFHQPEYKQLFFWSNHIDWKDWLQNHSPTAMFVVWVSSFILVLFSSGPSQPPTNLRCSMSLGIQRSLHLRRQPQVAQRHV